MHPNVFLKAFWRMEMQEQVFVAMDFGPIFKPRFDKVYAPAIKTLTMGDTILDPYRVDLSKTGDSLLSDIMDGIAHSRLVLADVSTVYQDSATGKRLPNGNVMYEVGLALACRQTSEVLLVRDTDTDKTLFDVSTIPHITIDFSNEAKAIEDLSEALYQRLIETDFIRDARVRLAATSLTSEELSFIQRFKNTDDGVNFGYLASRSINFGAAIAISRLLDKQAIKLTGRFDDGEPTYQWTQLGRFLAQVATTLPTHVLVVPPSVGDPAGGT